MAQIGKQRPILSTALVAAALWSAPGAAQTKVTIAECEDCEVEPDLVVELGDLDGPGAFSDPARVVQRLNGQWVVTDFLEPEHLKVFSADGSFLRQLGRSGAGPGEYRMALVATVGRDDSLTVFDMGQLRATVLSPSLAPVRTVRLPVQPMRASPMPGGYVVMGPAPDEPAHLHVVSSEGDITASFGVPESQGGRVRRIVWWAVAAAVDGTVWTGHVHSHEVQQWEPHNGLAQRTFVRSTPRFDPRATYGSPSDPSHPPASSLTAVWIDGSDRVWTATNLPDPEWSAAFGAGRDPYGRPTRRVQDVSRYHDTLIEVVSPDDASVVAWARLDDQFLSFPSEGLIATTSFAGAGYPIVRVWRIEVPAR